jgi:hypothetical protein
MKIKKAKKLSFLTNLIALKFGQLKKKSFLNLSIHLKDVVLH